MPVNKKPLEQENSIHNAIGYADVTPDDNTDLPVEAKGFYIGTGGDLELVSINGDTVVFHNLQAGLTYPFWAKRVKSSGTTASDIVALY